MTATPTSEAPVVETPSHEALAFDTPARKMPVGKTLARKIWDSHRVRQASGGNDLIYVDLHLIHEPFPS
ncbi:hypothetical protein [Actinomadura rubrisoli]|uniref:3-isopropylmalate dehydratase large subunit n=1 Tax=Actinomadura rubrisoli TaxID=2530368 RepID=A0A4R5BCH9_9ACTN|nr:hypothetical protein [Actinomadura rubrisoli]TDD83851.1 hypothetical protein E1298_20855 [Actinomadura rubrisoli]